MCLQGSVRTPTDADVMKQKSIQEIFGSNFPRKMSFFMHLIYQNIFCQASRGEHLELFYILRQLLIVGEKSSVCFHAWLNLQGMKKRLSVP